MISNSRSVAMTVSSILAMSSPAWAAQPAAEEGGLEEVIVTAQFREENLQDTPLSITAISGERLDEQGLTNVSDLGLVIPNANIRQQGNIFGPNPQIGMRGVNTSEFIYTAEPGVAVYVDDVYHGTLTGSSMDLLDLERVEVLRGPQGTLFGKNALGGAIRLISKAPKGDDTGYAEVNLGTSNRLDIKASYDMSLVPDRVFMRVSGVSKKIDGYQDRIDFTCQMIANGTPALAGSLPSLVPSSAANKGDCKIGENGGSQSSAVRAALRFLAAENVDINLVGDYSRTNAQPGADSLLVGANPNDGLNILHNDLLIEPTYGIRYTDSRFVTGDPYKTYGNYNDPIGGARWTTEQITDSWSISGKADIKIGENMNLKTVIAHRAYDTTWASDGDLTPFDISTTLNLQTHKQTSAEVQLSGSLLTDRLAWTVGAFYFDSNSELGGYVTLGALAFGGVIPNFAQNDAFTTESKSAFAHGVITITDRLSLTAGIRQTDETKTFDFDHSPFLKIPIPLNYGSKHFDWKAAVDFKLSENKMVYGSVSTGFRSDGAQPRPFVASQLTSVPMEEIIAYEIGFKGDFLDRRLRVNASVFLNDYDPRVSSRFGLACGSPVAGEDPNPFVPFGSPCPAGSFFGQLGGGGIPWINYFVAPGKAKGGELEVSASPVDGLLLNATAGLYTYKSAERDPAVAGFYDSSVREQPKLSYSLGGQYTFKLASGSITPRLDWFYQGKRTNNLVSQVQRSPEDIIPSYGTASARITFKSEDDRWNAALSAENLFDKFYFIALSPQGLFNRNGVPSRGREITLTIRRDF
jgi:iron complex outermembrane recepter protein